MRLTMPMIAVAATGLTLASSAGANDIDCKIPWWQPLPVQCGNLGSLKPGETMRIDLLSVTQDDGNTGPGMVYLTLFDTNTRTTVTPTKLELHAKNVAWYKNETKAEIAIRADVTYGHPKKVILKFSSKLEP